MEPKLKDKNWDKTFEPQIYNDWKAKEIYKFEKKGKKPVYSIDTPPPYVNTPVHIGQVTGYVMMDMFARYKRMTGHSILFPLGLDRNGLPIEMAAEKKFNIKLTQVTREKAIELCRKILEESSLASVESFLRCGIGFNSWKIGTELGEIYETDSPDYRALTQETFIDLWKKGLVYEDTRINNWCPGCQTTLADAEVIYKELPTKFNDIIFKCKETGENLIIGTTRPELVCTCAMVIFNPADDKYKHLEGKTAITPIFNKEVPIKSHPFAEIGKGTGLVMMCSAGDLTDIQFFREMKLEPVIAINKDGTMNAHAGFLEGLPVKEARNKMIETLKEKSLLVKQTEVMHRSPICERSKDPIEFIAMPEFYVKQVEYKTKMKELAHQLNFFEQKSRQRLLDWIESVSIDWPISRRRYYATEVPLWYCKNCNEPILPEIKKKPIYYQPWKENPPIKACPKCKGKEFKGEERVFDTWFDSSISPLYILKYNRDKKFFEKAMPCTLRPQGKEIIRTWLYYTMLKCYLLTGKLIFKDAWINYHITDENGKKMSKSIGNVIDPKDVLDKFGAEPFRLWAVIEGNLTKTDFRCSFERIEGAGKTLTKLWNIARFVSMFPEPEGKIKLTELDKWIIQETNNLIKLAKNNYEQYDFHTPATAIKNFIWETFASHYIELVKNRAYNEGNKFSKEEQNGGLYALHYCLDVLLHLLAPILPMITQKIYQELRGKDIHFEKFPEIKKEYKQA
ncbi:MAG: valine--tRNA ligase, partial [Candidatus Woesearchaeota archaeon]